MAKKRKKPSRVTTLVDIAAAAVGLVSLARELLQHHEATRQRSETATEPVTEGDGVATSARPPSPSQYGRGATTLGALNTALDTAQALIDVNAAPPQALRSLDRITKRRARRIVSHRPFKRVKDLKRVLPTGVYKTVKQHLTV
jgi:DNA uptake protein ComE-like DNA-binding protein